MDEEQTVQKHKSVGSLFRNQLLVKGIFNRKSNVAIEFEGVPCRHLKLNDGFDKD